MATGTNGLLRPQYFERQQLRAADLTAEQEYVRERIRRHNRYLHGWGVVCGAEVSASEKGTWLLSIGEGYAVTPLGDEIYIPADTTFDLEPEIQKFLEAPSSCRDLEDLLESAGDGPLRVIRASIDPSGNDLGSSYNDEWVDLLLLESIDLNGYSLQHLINPGTKGEPKEAYYTFEAGDSFPAGTVIRVHSGSQARDLEAEPRIVHRYAAGSRQQGNWRFNNQGDMISVMNARGEEVASASFQPGSRDPVRKVTVYLAASPLDKPCCPKPVVPVDCQPGGMYEYSRMCETVQFHILSELPASHHQEGPSCEELDEIVNSQAHAPCPPAGAEDHDVVLARLEITGDTVTIDDQSARRRLLSESLLMAYIRCRCEAIEPPRAAFQAELSATVPFRVQFTDQSTGEITGWLWDFGGVSTSNEQNPVYDYQAAGSYNVKLTVSGPGGTDTISETITVERPLSDCAREILEAGEIRVAISKEHSWPFKIPTGDGRWDGFAIQLTEAIVYRLFNSTVKISWLPVTEDMLATMLAVGEPPHLFIQTPGGIHQDLFDLWSGNYFLDGLRFLVLRDGNISELKDMNGKVLAARDAITAEIVADMLRALGIDLSDVLWNDDISLLHKQLLEKQIDIVAGFWSSLLAISQDDPALEVIGEMLSMIDQSPYAIAVRPGCPGLRAEIDEILDQFLEDGTWQELYAKWFPDPPPWTLEEMHAAQLPEPRALPQAAFNAEPAGGTAPLAVHFTDQSTGTITGWVWNFGDQNTSSLQNPVHTYPRAGNYEVVLTVNGPAGTNTASQTITVTRILSPCAQRILQAGEIKAAISSVELWPFITQGAGGQLTGFAVELMQAIVDDLFGGAVGISWLQVDQFELDTMVDAGDFPDLYIRTPEPPIHEFGLQSGNYFLDGPRLLVLRGGNIHELTDLEGKVLAAAESYTLDKAADLLREMGIDIGDTRLGTDSIPLRQELIEGGIDAVIAPWWHLVYLTQEYPQLQVIGEILPIYGDPWPYAISIHPDCPGLRDEVDEILDLFLQDGTWRTLYNKWFPDPPPWTLEEMHGSQPGIEISIPVPELEAEVKPGEPVVETDTDALDLVRAREETVDVIDGIGKTRSSRLHAANVNNLLDLINLPPEKTAEIAGVSVEVAVQWQATARKLLGRPGT